MEDFHITCTHLLYYLHVHIQCTCTCVLALKQLTPAYNVQVGVVSGYETTVNTQNGTLQQHELYSMMPGMYYESYGFQFCCSVVLFLQALCE